MRTAACSCLQRGHRTIHTLSPDPRTTRVRQRRRFLVFLMCQHARVFSPSTAQQSLCLSPHIGSLAVCHLAPPSLSPSFFSSPPPHFSLPASMPLVRLTELADFPAGSDSDDDVNLLPVAAANSGPGSGDGGGGTFVPGFQLDSPVFSVSWHEDEVRRSVMGGLQRAGRRRSGGRGRVEKGQ